MAEDILAAPLEKAAAWLQSKGFSDGRLALKNLRLLSVGPLKGLVEEITSLAALSPSPDGALNNLEGIVKEETEETILEFLKDPLNLKRLITISGSSPFLSNIALQPRFFEWLFLKGGLSRKKDLEVFREELKDRLKDAVGLDEAARGLRLYKQQEFLRIGTRDILGMADVREVTGELSGLASACLDEACNFSLRTQKQKFGPPLYTREDGAVKEAEFAVIGLGKLGGRELNFSSDIDIIYVYSSDKGETTGVEGKEASTRISLHDFFVKLSVMATRLLSGVTEDGFVFRIDLNLRPEGRGGDMANSLRSLEVYYESWGKSWERAAMIKARPVAGSLTVGEAFLSMIRPFVYRRYLDFTAIEEIKSMKERIDLGLLRRAPDAVDVKLGAGGIREIEFFVQTLQLIHGGKDKDVRDKNTLKAVEKLRDKGFIKEEDARLLSDGYIFLRSLEHRIQIVDERQSHAIPAKPHELTRLARMMGFADTEAKPAGEQFWDEYEKKTSRVHDIYKTLFYKETSFKDIPGDILTLLSPDVHEDEAVIILSRLGFKDPKAAHRNISMIRSGPLSRRLVAKAQVLLQRLLPVFIAKAAVAPDPDRALLHLERFISAIGGRTAFYALLFENPGALGELVKLFGTSVFLSRGLIDHPENLDILLSKELSIPYKKKEAVLEAFLEESLDPAKDYEERLDSLRRLRNQEIMRIGMNDIAGCLNQHQVSIQMTFLAEACLEAAYRAALDELKRLYGNPPKGSSFTILGLGKLGGRELIYGSDLDIVFVYEDAPYAIDAPYAEDANRPKGGSNHEFFIRLGQKIISILTLRTREGFLFNVDTRLRPSGSSGPLVVSLSSIINYHKGRTMIWERQALTKARRVAGDEPFGGKVLKELEAVLYSRPLTREDIDEMQRIRGRMEAEIAKEGAGRFNIKTGRGGVVDVEFLAQALQLRYGPSLVSIRTPHTQKALSRMRKSGVLPSEDYKLLKEAYSFYRLLEMKQRIVHDRPEGVIEKGSEELSSLARRAGYEGADAGEELLNDYMGYADKVRGLYLKTLEGLE